MVFSSVTFLFFFLPCVLAAYHLTGPRTRNLVLLAASLLFYSWGEGVYILVMLVSILANYVCGILLAANTGTANKKIVISGIFFNIVLLGFFKYANFLVDNFNAVLAVRGLPGITLDPVHLPIGISFFTFQAMSYIIDVYRGKVEPQRNLVSLSLYITLFPQLIAGPIVRYLDIAAQLVERKQSLAGFADGVRRFLFGLGKKVLIANPLAVVADQVFALQATELSPAVAWLGALCYTFQIYFDFSGYSDMAIGIGKIFGFTFPENFNYPYISRSFREFWRRWHISLSSWLRDYLYIPLGGSRHGNRRTYLNLMVVFTLCGLWHGASWTFVVWGLYHGVFLIIERSRFGHVRQRLWVPLQIPLTFVFIVIGWVIFRSQTLGEAATFLHIMFGQPLGLSTYPLAKFVDNQILFVLAAAVLLSLPLYPALQRLQDQLDQAPARLRVWLLSGSYVLQLCYLLAMFYFAAISLAAAVYNPFIYFRF